MSANVKIVEKIKTSGKLVNPTETAVNVIRYALKNNTSDKINSKYYNQIIADVLNLLNSTFWGRKQILSIKDENKLFVKKKHADGIFDLPLGNNIDGKL